MSTLSIPAAALSRNFVLLLLSVTLFRGQALSGMGVTPKEEAGTLNAALREARLRVWPLTAEESSQTPGLDARWYSSCGASDLLAVFCGDRVRLSAHNQEWTLEIGRGGEAVHAEAQERKVSYRYANGVTEWFRTEPGGLLHGYTIEHPPENGSLWSLVTRVEGLDVTAPADPRDGLAFCHEGRPVLSYRGLHAWDAAGSILPAAMRAGEAGIVIEVETAHAVYPVTVDPLIALWESKLTPPVSGAGGTGEWFGWALAADGDRIAVGSYSGGVDVFRKAGGVWQHEARLLAADSTPNAKFGYSLALSGDTLVIGEPDGKNSAGVFTGVAHIYQFSGGVWQPATKFTSPAPKTADYFGTSVALHGDCIAVEAPGVDAGYGSSDGAVYVYSRSGGQWALEQAMPWVPCTILGADRVWAYSRRTGTSVALGNGVLLAGAPDGGEVMVFRRGVPGWRHETTLFGPGPLPNDQFGSLVALEGNVAAIAAPSADASAATPNSGRVYIHTNQGAAWPQSGFVEAPAPAANRQFGTRMHMTQDALAVTMPGAPPLGAPADPSEVHLFNRSNAGWTWHGMVSAPPPPTPTAWVVGIGAAVALTSDGLAIAAAYDYAGMADGSGSVGFYRNTGVEWQQYAKVTAGSREAGNYFGYEVAIDGEVAVVGAPRDNTAAGMEAGSVWVLRHGAQGWTANERLVPENPGRGDRFGASVALDGDMIASGTEIGGPVTVFRYNGQSWLREASLRPAASQPGDEFGKSVALSKNTLIAGARVAPLTNFARGPGRAWVFERSTAGWLEQAMLAPPDGVSGDLFGHAVAIDGDTAVVGAFYHSVTEDQRGQGAAYVFQRTGNQWQQQAKLHKRTPAEFDKFAISLDISGDTIISGAFTDDPGVTDAGTAHVFTRSGGTWTLEEILSAPEKGIADYFGISVAVDGHIAAVGAYQDDTSAGANAGSVHLFLRQGNSWTHQGGFLAPDGATENHFGISVALSGSRLVAGSWLDDADSPGAWPAIDQGSAHSFRLGAGQDSDNDRLPDDWELDSFRSLACLPDEDPDGDGQSNLLESLAGTHGGSAESRLHLLTERRAAPVW